MSELILWVSELILWVSELILWVSEFPGGADNGDGDAPTTLPSGKGPTVDGIN